MARSLTRRESGRVVAVLFAIWLVIGLAAAVQRGYFGSSQANCSSVGTTVVTILAGPLNYVGANPKIRCETPQPSR